MGTPADERPTDPAPLHPNPPAGIVVAIGVLLAIPVVALLWVSSYAKATPTLWGFPFFYWYQFLWVFLAAICTSLAYRLLTSATRRARGGEDR